MLQSIAEPCLAVTRPRMVCGRVGDACKREAGTAQLLPNGFMSRSTHAHVYAGELMCSLWQSQSTS